MEKIKQEFVLRRIAGENVLIPVGNQGDKFQGIITLNETGRFIWEKLEEGKNLEEIAETITEEYEVSREKAERDVNRICEQLRKLEIL